MIKKCVVLFLAINISSLYAILGGIGINGSYDSFTVSAETIASSPVGSIERTDLSSPLGSSPAGIGIFAYLTVIPFLDFET